MDVEVPRQFQEHDSDHQTLICNKNNQFKEEESRLYQGIPLRYIHSELNRLEKWRLETNQHKMMYIDKMTLLAELTVEVAAKFGSNTPSFKSTKCRLLKSLKSIMLRCRFVDCDTSTNTCTCRIMVQVPKKRVHHSMICSFACNCDHYRSICFEFDYAHPLFYSGLPKKEKSRDSSSSTFQFSSA